MPRLLFPALALLLAACQLSLPGASGGTAAAPANPLTGDAIAVTSLDAAPPAIPPAAEPAPPEPPAAEPVPPEPQSPEQIACERRGGSYARAGAGDARACIRPTRDGGKQCRRESDCEGTCLARSQTCAPITPMFGCNDILQDDGRRVTLCLD